MGERKTDIDTLKKRLSKWDKLVHGLKLALGAYAFLVLTYLAVQGIIAQQQIAVVTQRVNDTIEQVRESQLANQKTGTENHEKTREYIRCIANALLVPVAQRNEINFDDCTQAADVEAESDTPTPTPPTNPPTSVLPSPSAVNPKPTEPTTAAPPDPDQPIDDRSALGKLPVVGGLLDLIGL